MRRVCLVLVLAAAGCGGSEVAFDDAGTDGSVFDGVAADGTGSDGTPSDGGSADGSTDGSAGDGAADILLPDGGCGGTLCGGKCTDTKTDPANCGTCGTACPDGTPACIDGKCSCPPSSTCGGACVDLSSDIDNCGTCGNACNDGELCVAGKCVCNAGTTDCGGTCVDTKADGANCGGCGTACKTGEVCSGGVCLSSSKGCSGGLTICPKTGPGPFSCVDLKRSNANCGECGRACAVDQACVAGDCRDVTPGAFCKTCPCPTCGGDTPLCCAPLVTGANAFCIDAKTCPTL